MNTSKLDVSSYSVITESICKKGMGEILLFLLESHRPVVNLANQVLIAFSPFIKFFVKKELLNLFLTIFDSHENFNNFISQLSKTIDKQKKL